MNSSVAKCKVKFYPAIDEQNLTLFSQHFKGFPTRQTVERIRKQYPRGTRVELLHMVDRQAPPIGTLGTVLGVDDTGSLLMRWDNGTGLNVIYGEDLVRKI